MKNILKKFFCLHDWIEADSLENPYLKIRYSIGARDIWICPHCGKITHNPTY